MAPLLGVLFAILVALLAIRPYLAYQQQAFDNVKAANTAAQFRQIIDAAKIYVQEKCLPSQSSGTTTCGIIPVSTLVTQGLLPSGTISANPYGQTWNIAVSQQGSTVQAFVYSSGGMPIPPQQAPEIAAETGADAGFMPTPGQYNIYNVSANTAVGAYGHWTAPAPSGAQAGDLVAQLNLQTQDNDYLYRTIVQGDPSANSMGTALNMSGNDITNAKTVYAQGLDVLGTNATNVNIGDNSSAPANVDIGTSNSNSTDLEVGENSSGPVTLDVGKNANGATNLTIGSGSSNTSNLTIGGNGAAGELILTSAPQAVGSDCSSTQLGTIAPITGGAGTPVVCAAPAQTGSLQYGTNGGSITISASSSTSTASPTWQLLGGQNFTTLQEATFQPFFLNGSATGDGVYVNNTSQSLFISSNCPLNNGSSGVGGSSKGFIFGSNPGTSINFYLAPASYLSSFSSLDQISGMAWTLSGVSTSGGVSSPASSVIVPPNYAFAYSLYADSNTNSCEFTVAY